jgi:hypothetical protein
MNAIGGLELEQAGMPSGMSSDAGQVAFPTPEREGAVIEAEETPEILQIVPANGWWVDRPTIDEDTGAVMQNRGRAIAFALCKFSDRVEIRPIDDGGKIVNCNQLSHESDAGILSKYKKRARAKPGETDEKGNPADGLPGGMKERGMTEKPDEMRIKHLKTSLFEGLQWVSAILDKDPGDELLRACRQQLRWMQSAVDNGRRPTISELGQLTLTATIVPELQDDDPYLAEMLTEIENIYRDL